ncbi:TolC family protein [soil metagenome]
MNTLFSTLKRRTGIFVLTVALLSSGSGAYAQKVWTLKECVEYALQHNITVKQQYLNTELAKINTDANLYTMFPSLNGSGSSSYNWGRSVDPFTYQFTTEEIRSSNLSLNTNLILFNGFQLQNTLRQSKLDYLSNKSDLQKIQNDIALNVVSAYLQVLYAREQLSVIDARVEESKKQRDRTKLMADAGSMTRGNLLDAEAQLTTEELNKITADNSFSTSKLNLMQLMELDSVNDFAIDKPTADLPALVVLGQTPEQIFEAALAQLPEIKSAALKIQSSEKSLDIAKGSYMPRLSMFGSYSSGYSSASQQIAGSPVYQGLQPTGAVTSTGEAVLSPIYFSPTERTPWGTQLDNNLTRSLGLSLSVPIFNGFSSRYNVARAKISVLNAKYSSDLTRNQLYKSIQQAYVDASAGRKKMEATDKSVQALQEAYDYAEKRYNAGLTSSLEFLTSTNNLTKGKIEALQAKYDFIFKVKVLDFYAGNPLVF